ncbi:DUF3810 domain-containing protein [Flavitalea flava]
MGFYPVIARIQRLMFGWIPISIGDLLYAILAIWLVAGLISIIRSVIKRRADGPYFLSLLRRILFGCLLVYVLFNGLWGLNYDRQGIADQLQLTVKPYSTDELTGLLTIIAQRLNEVDSISRPGRDFLNRNSHLFAGSVQSYTALAQGDSRFAYPSPSVKASMFSYLGNYLGFGGYYNPFSGEAQVNTTMPVFTRPFTACHEIGHQLGYAKENEANFAGYLAARSSPDPAFRYSVYFDLYIYAARELYARDSNLIKPYREKLRPSIRKDFQELKRFNRQFENPLEPVIRRLYGNYLIANGQPQGIMTYNEVIAWLIAYQKKMGPGAI